MMNKSLRRVRTFGATRGLAGVGCLVAALGAPAQQPAAPEPVPDAAVPKPACIAPVVPERFPTQLAQDQFTDQARVYENCISKFIAEQKALSTRHAEAANQAAADFNQFAAALARAQPAPGTQ